MILLFNAEHSQGKEKKERQQQIYKTSVKQTKHFLKYMLGLL